MQTDLKYSRDTEIDAGNPSGTMLGLGPAAKVSRFQPSAEPRVIGRYALFDEIASGGMGVVHFGRLLGSAGFERVVAIKRGHAGFASDPELVAMFHEEVRLFSRIRHPNVVAALDVVEDGGELLLVMEYVHGVSLSQLARKARETDRPVPIVAAVTIACHVLRGLHAAHTAKSAAGEPLGIVHRDVSPQNVLVGCDGAARILDFGVAKAVDSQPMTRAGHVKGKLSYAPPEQIRGCAVDRRSDVYGAAVVLWELLANGRLFSGSSSSETIQSVLAGNVPSLSQVAPRPVPTGIEAVVRRGLEADPSRRFESARDMAQALEQQIALMSEEELGEWVTQAAKEMLAERSRRLAFAENCPVAAPRPSLLTMPLIESLSEDDVVEVARPSSAVIAARPLPQVPPPVVSLASRRKFWPVAVALMLVSVLGGVAMARSRMAPSATSPNLAALVAKPPAIVAVPDPSVSPEPPRTREIVTVAALPVEEPGPDVKQPARVAKQPEIAPEPKLKRHVMVAPKTDTLKPILGPRAAKQTRSRDGVDDGF